MTVIVQKFGGSSVADVERIGLVADRVVATKRAGHDVVVVVSAMGKTTDGLLALARSAAHAAEGTGEPPRRELDMLVSTGERVSMALLSIAIHARGEDAISFTGSQSGILTNDRHFDARILEVRPHRIEDELARGRIVIVAGYQGMSYRREITTLGRGGSDTTAVALAAALGAERCEIYSDVDGVYSADPRVVPEARHLPTVDVAMLQEMAEAGAKVLNAQAVEWARRAGIVLHARKTSDPLPGAARAPLAQERLVKETVVAPIPRGPRADARPVRAIVGWDGIVALGLPAADLLALTDIAAELGVPLVDVAVAGSEGSAVVPLANVPDWARCAGSLRRALGTRLRVDEGLSLVSVVGEGLTQTALGIPTFLRALQACEVPQRGLVAGPLRIGAVVPRESAGAVQRALHRAFVEAES